MRQSTSWAAIFCLSLIAIACDGSSDTSAINSAPATGTIVSMSPAASELVAAMGLRSRIVGVSGYEADPELKKLPKVGDYLNVDWERLAELKPSLLIIQGKRDRLPPGVRERAEGMGIKVLVLQVDRFGDILGEIGRIGEYAGAVSEASALQASMTKQIEAIRASHLNAAKAPSLLVLSEDGTFVAGVDNYLNDILTDAGGENVITSTGYVKLDGEKLRSLAPQHVFVLIPNATDDMIATAKKQLGVLQAVRDGRMHVIKSADALLPGAGTIKIAQTMADAIQGDSKSPTTQP